MTTTSARMTAGESIDDWLNLVDPDGAFLTPAQLRRAGSNVSVGVVMRPA